MRYPNGRLPGSTQGSIKPPERMKAEDFLALVQGKESSAANRGMSLEDELNESNTYYVANRIAAVHKKPTPIQIVKVDYPSRSAAVIKEAYFRQPSTTDYNGLFEGRHIDFEAKETRNRTALPLSNFHAHQIDHMRLILHHQGIAFAIIRFTVHDETYILDASHIIQFWEEAQQGGRKSIPYSYITEHGHLVPVGYRPRLDYLSVIRQHYFM
ncbi:Holliday junction resolvase RecU [Aneurinibacillus sp. BA2021]|nr:Holliday junction resolvase RecU [Aneurinibacillus sp. BA2021]